MADSPTIAGNKISTEEITLLNGSAVTAEQVQRVIPAYRTADGAAVDGTAHASIEATTMQNAVAATGNGTSIDTSSMETLLLSVAGITTATIIVEGEFPSGTWNTLNVKNASGGALSTSITANGIYVAHVAGYLNVRARISAWTSGTITVVGTATAAGNKAEMQNVAMPQVLSPQNDGVLTSPKGGSSSNITASTLLLTGPGKLQGVFVAAASATPTLKFWDSTAASSTVLIGTFTPLAATMYTFGPGGIRCTTGIYCTISGTVDCTPIWDPLTT